jgi:hypothetical protein
MHLFIWDDRDSVPCSWRPSCPRGSLVLCPGDSCGQCWYCRVSRVSTVAVQRFCKPKVGGSNPSPGTNKNNGLSGHYPEPTAVDASSGQRLRQQKQIAGRHTYPCAPPFRPFILVAPAETTRCYRRLERQTRAAANCQFDSMRLFWEHLLQYPVVAGRVCRTLALLVLSPAWQSLPVAGLPPADFAGAAS